MLIPLALKDIPQNVIDEVMASLKNFVVVVYVVLKGKPLIGLRIIGSGTLVEINGSHHILTAAHVWYETQGTDEIGLVLTDHQSAFTIPRDAISVKELWNGNESDWGPDVALLKLPGQSISAIAAHKSFLNLDRQKEDLASCPPTTENGLWALTGMVEEKTEILRYPEKGIIEGHVQGSAFFSSVQQVYERDDFDYFDLEANLQLSEVPRSFAGLSGGGLWDVKLMMDQSKQISWDQKRYFRGVVFGQTKASEKRRRIRCHGPKSIFETAWKLWGLT